MENILNNKPKFDLTKIVKNNTVHFDHYRNGLFYYTVKTDDEVYRFPVELNDVGSAAIMKEDKALIYMRYIRKAIENHMFVKVN